MELDTGAGGTSSGWQWGVLSVTELGPGVQDRGGTPRPAVKPPPGPASATPRPTPGQLCPFENPR